MSLNHLKSIMPPPWLAFPNIERYSIGWRMGSGEDYIYRFADWLESLSEAERSTYRQLFPEPITWQGWWDDDDTSEALEHKDFYVQAWQPQGLAKYSRSQLEQEWADGQTKDQCFFWGHQPSKTGQITQSCLSQWWKAEFYAVASTFFYMEQYMMAAKAELFGDEDCRAQILRSTDPKEIKALGRQVQGFEQAIWDQFKFSIVLNGNYLKFSQNPQLKDYLLATDDSILVEASPEDAIWGIALPAHAKEAQNPCSWQGQNLLGFALMEVRDELRRVHRNAHLCDWSVVS